MPSINETLLDRISKFIGVYKTVITPVETYKHKSNNTQEVEETYDAEVQAMGKTVISKTGFHTEKAAKQWADAYIETHAKGIK